MSPDEIEEAMNGLNDEDRAELDRLLTDGMPIWSPMEGPQQRAHDSEADILGYGGAAGGGKTDLEVGLALTKHTRSIIYRKEGTQLQGIYDRIEEITETRDGFNSQSKIWRIDDKIIQFGGLANPQDHKKYQGIPHDLKCFDEATEIPRYMVEFLMGWKRSSQPGQRTRVIMTFNPPTTPEGRWVIEFFAPWLDPMHPNPAAPGELRWFTTIDGKEVEVESGKPILVEGEYVQPLSRTFIPAKVEDNIYYMESGYKATLQSLPEPLRSQMLKGDFSAGVTDDPWQVIPSAWVDMAMARWEEKAIKPPMDSLGVDVACGGKDKTCISARHGNWFDKLQDHPGADTPNGALTAALVIAARRDNAPVHVDVVGWGKDTHTHLIENNIHTIAINGINATDEKTKPVKNDTNGQLSFYNFRSMMYWRMREELNPANNTGVALPPDPALKAELCAHKWELRSRGIFVLSKDKVKEILGHSPDKSDAVVMANIKTMKKTDDFGQVYIMDNDYDPLA